MKILLNICRFIVGILFIFSGLIKANDPLGLSYKMQEFFELWNMAWLDNFSLAFSILMIVFEILAGVAVLLGWRMKLFSWLLLVLIIFFTFLTGYAYLSGKVKECGCFGNCIPLTAGQSFAKDIILLLLIVFLFIYREKIIPFIPNFHNLLILFFTVVISFSIQWYALEYLPFIDCLPYKVGVSIPEKMKPPPGAIQDSSVITFIYDRNGKQLEFTADHFPADFDDSYKFVKRYDKLIRKGNAEPDIKDFSLLTASGNDTTQALLQEPGYNLFMFAKEMSETNPDWNKEFASIYSLVRVKGMTVFFITAHPDQVENYFVKNEIATHLQILKCDVTAIKTAARATPTLYLLKKGIILNKWSYANFENAISEISILPSVRDK